MYHDHMRRQPSSLGYGIIALLLVGWIGFLVVYDDGITSPSQPNINQNSIVTDISDDNPRQKPPVVLSEYQQQEQEILPQFAGTGQYSWLVTGTYDQITKDLQLSVSGLQNIVPTTIINSNANNSTVVDLQRLEYVYESTKDPAVLSLLVQKYLLDYSYTRAYELIAPLTLQQQLSVLSGEKLLALAFNGPLMDVTRPASLGVLTGLIQGLRSRGQISDDVVYRYEWLIQIANGQVSVRFTQLKKITNPTYLPLINIFNQRLQYHQSQKDLPEYYLQGLIALDLMNQWYFKVAQQMSAQILQKNENYILPYQILAYSHFVLNNRSVAKEYLLKLSELDPPNKQRYLFMLGVSSFRMDEPRDAIVYLWQVTDAVTKSDVLRYQLISYQRISDSVNQARSIQQLLARPDLQQSDFGTMFDLFFFDPYAQRTWFAFYRANIQLAILTLDQCYAKLPVAQQTICTYGKAGILLAQWELDKATQYLYYLTTIMPTAPIYLALGQYYAQAGDSTKARDFMLKAALLTRDGDTKQRIKEEIISISQ